MTTTSNDHLGGRKSPLSQSQMPPADECQMGQNFLQIIRPHQPTVDDVSQYELVSRVEWNDKKLSRYSLDLTVQPTVDDVSQYELVSRVAWNDKKPSRNEEINKLANDDDNSEANHIRPVPIAQRPSPYTNSKPTCESPFSSGKESNTILSTFVSLSRRCFKMEDREITAQNFEKKLIQNKPKVISSGEEFRRRLEAPIIKVICLLWHTLTSAQRCGQFKSNNTQTKQMSAFELCTLKLPKAKCSLISERETSAATATVEPEIPNESQETETEERDLQFLWAETWRPKRLGDFLCHKQQVRELQLLVSQRRCPHMIFEGPPGVGKTSLVRAMIQEIFQSQEQIRHGKITIQVGTWAESVTKIVVPIKATSNHIEINLSNLSGYERNIIGLLIRELHKARLETNMTESAVDYKVIVIGEADKLTSDVQQYIHWLMERYQDSCKLIFCCSTVNNLQSISSLCKVIEIEPPTNEQMIEVLEHIAKKEGITLPRPFAQRIAENSDKNLRQAIRSLEACSRSQYPFIEDQKILTGWEDDITKIAQYIMEEQSPKQLYKIRGKLQNLVIHNVDPSFVFTFLVEELKHNLDDNLQMKLQNLYVAFKGNSFNDGEPLTENQRTRDRVQHAKRNAYLYVKIEEFTARCMSVYKSMKTRPT
ncbi:replication factor C subunit 3 isoform X1 [Cryptomeria japonica]|uniref:replication factor C subunit 3 isoform X1 n=1 Tax=Cryptomeria japonica TaxID=3369 RepID=UPI0025AC56F4|nr:replication factor C subunit 3 isoform X1 [Cryptomeria japonica]